jgi:hypothetical protein
MLQRNMFLATKATDYSPKISADIIKQRKRTDDPGRIQQIIIFTLFLEILSDSTFI